TSGATTGGTPIMITGQNFKSGCTVKVGSVDATGVTFIDANHVNAITPAGAAGPANVRVVNPDGQGGGFPNAFTYTQVMAPAPVVSSVTPTSGATTGGTPIMITGQNFKSGCTVKVGSVDATGVTFIDANHVNAITPAGAAGPANVRVVNPDGQGGGLPNAFTYTQVMALAPVVSSVTPTSGATTGGTPIMITGQNFKSGCTVKVGSVDATGVTFIDANHVNAITPSGMLGAANARVVNPDGQGGNLSNAFTYMMPIVKNRPLSLVTALGKLPTRKIAAGELTSFDQSFVAEPGIEQCARVIALGEGSIPSTIQVAVNPALNSAICPSGFIQTCQSGNSPNKCGEYFVSFTTAITTPAGDYIFGEFFDDNVDGIPDEPVRYKDDGTPVRVRLRIRQPKVKIKVINGPSQITAGEVVTYTIQVQRDGYIGPIDLSLAPLPDITSGGGSAVLSRTSFPNNGADAVDTVTLTVATVKPMGGMTAGTPQGMYNIMINAVSPIGVPIMVTSATVTFTVMVRPDVDITIEPKSVDGNTNDLPTSDMPIPVDAGGTVEFIVKIFRYNYPANVPLNVTALPPMAKLDPPPPLTPNGNGTRTRYLLRVKIDPNTPAMKFPVTVQTVFTRDGVTKMPKATATVKVRKSEESIIVAPDMAIFTTRAATCLSCNVNVSLINFETSQKVDLKFLNLPHGISPVFGKSQLDPAKGETVTTLAITVDEAVPVSLSSYVFQIQGSGATDPKLVSDPVDITINVTQRPLVRLFPLPPDNEVIAQQGTTMRCEFDVLRNNPATCSAQYTGAVTLDDPLGLPSGVTAVYTNNMPTDISNLGVLMITVPSSLAVGRYPFTVMARTDGADIQENPAHLTLVVTPGVGGNTVAVTGPQSRPDPFQGGEIVTVTWNISGDVDSQTVAVLPADGISFTGMEMKPDAAVRSQQFILPNPTGTVVAGIARVTVNYKSGPPMMADLPFSLAFTSGPDVRDVSPNPAPRGETIMIKGSGFIPGRTKIFFTAAAGGFVEASAVVMPTLILAVVPGTAVNGEARVINPFVFGELSEIFSFNFSVQSTPPSPGPKQGAPRIATFSPLRGVIGTHVEISGSGFTRVTGVSFNGVPAQYNVLSPMAIDAIVPAGARSGPIIVTTAVGEVRSTVFFQVTIGTRATGDTPSGRLPGNGA
ncbi:MAG: IPT/TIG domain-containing protein, partial [Candidatus Kapaibacterium sp.]